MSFSPGLVRGTLRTASVDRLRVEVLARYRREPGFTQGLELCDGHLYESTGLVGQSEVRVVDPVVGNVVQRTALPANAFGEGITVVGDRLWQLTWQDGYALLRDRVTLAELRRVSFTSSTGEGWGLCYDRNGDRLVMSDGGPRLTFRDPETFDERGGVTVTCDGVPLPGINELEWVRTKVWANMYPTDQVVRIDPDTGVVEAVADATGLLPPSERVSVDVLNGIAAVPGTDAFLLTGKLWQYHFLIRFEPAWESSSKHPRPARPDAASVVGWLADRLLDRVVPSVPACSTGKRQIRHLRCSAWAMIEASSSFHRVFQQVVAGPAAAVPTMGSEGKVLKFGVCWARSRSIGTGKRLPSTP